VVIVPHFCNVVTFKQRATQTPFLDVADAYTTTATVTASNVDAITFQTADATVTTAEGDRGK